MEFFKKVKIYKYNFIYYLFLNIIRKRLIEIKLFIIIQNFDDF
jgi:hypothetical protein